MVGMAAFGGGTTFDFPARAASCVAAVPFGGSEAMATTAGFAAAAFVGGPVDAGGAALGVCSVVVLGALRQRLKIPNMRFPAN